MQVNMTLCAIYRSPSTSVSTSSFLTNTVQYWKKRRQIGILYEAKLYSCCAMLPGLAFLTWWAQALLPTLTWPWPLRQSLLYILCSFCTANISTIINTTFHCVPIFNVLLQDGDILLTMNYSGHFFSKLVNSSGHFLRVNSLGQFWWILMNIFCPWEFFSLGEFSWTFFGWILVDTFSWW